jgi:hypothetical protein
MLEQNYHALAVQIWTTFKKSALIKSSKLKELATNIEYAYKLAHYASNVVYSMRKLGNAMLHHILSKPTVHEKILHLQDWKWPFFTYKVGRSPFGNNIASSANI